MHQAEEPKCQWKNAGFWRVMCVYNTTNTRTQSTEPDSLFHCDESSRSMHWRKHSRIGRMRKIKRWCGLTLCCCCTSWLALKSHVELYHNEADYSFWATFLDVGENVAVIDNSLQLIKTLNNKIEKYASTRKVFNVHFRVCRTKKNSIEEVTEWFVVVFR